MSEVRLTLKVDSLRSLPEGAQYAARSGRAGVSVSKGREAGEVVVVASCDSLQRLVWLYEEELSRMRDETTGEETATEELTEDKSRRNALKTIILAFIAGAATGAILTTLIIGGARQNKQA